MPPLSSPSLGQLHVILQSQRWGGVCVCVTLWTTSPPGEEGWWTGSGSGVKEMSLHCGCITPNMGRLGKLSNHSEPQIPPQSKANNI